MGAAPQIRFVCSACKATGRGPLKLVGQTVACPNCKRSIRVPEESPIIQDDIDEDGSDEPIARSPAFDSAAVMLGDSRLVLWGSSEENEKNLRIIAAALIVISVVSFLLSLLGVVAIASGDDPRARLFGISLAVCSFMALVWSLLAAYSALCLAGIHEMQRVNVMNLNKNEA